MNTPPTDLSGLELLRLLMAGEIPAPSIFALLDLHMVEIGEGTATVEFSPTDAMLNLNGTVHGGVGATVLDVCMSGAIMTTLPPGANFTTAQLSVNYLRPIMPGAERIRARGTVLYPGRRQRTAQGSIVDAGDTLLAHGTTTCLLLGGS
jgi:uncharacterized protein (TIGR00369 family)